MCACSFATSTVDVFYGIVDFCRFLDVEKLVSIDVAVSPGISFAGSFRRAVSARSAASLALPPEHGFLDQSLHVLFLLPAPV